MQEQNKYLVSTPEVVVLQPTFTNISNISVTHEVHGVNYNSKQDTNTRFVTKPQTLSLTPGC